MRAEFVNRGYKSKSPDNLNNSTGMNPALAQVTQEAQFGGAAPQVQMVGQVQADGTVQPAMLVTTQSPREQEQDLSFS